MYEYVNLSYNSKPVTTFPSLQKIKTLFPKPVNNVNIFFNQYNSINEQDELVNSELLFG